MSVFLLHPFEAAGRLATAFDRIPTALYTNAMEIHFKPETESRLAELASKSGRPTNELVEDAMAAYLTEVAEVRATLDSRYDDIKARRVKTVDGERFFEDLKRREGELRERRSTPGNDR